MKVIFTAREKINFRKKALVSYLIFIPYHRSDHGSALGCKGVDPNRNWGFHYAESGLKLKRGL